jgi:hypothetical protein
MFCGDLDWIEIVLEYVPDACFNNDSKINPKSDTT